MKCRIGEERATALQLMRKFIAYQFTDEVENMNNIPVIMVELLYIGLFLHFCNLSLKPLQIKAVISKESLKGYIYIEAYKQTHVKQAIDGIGNLRMGQWSQQVCLDFGDFALRSFTHNSLKNCYFTI